MSGRRIRKNCPFCQHPERDSLELDVRAGCLDTNDIDRDQGWANGVAHRHMRNHAGAFFNESNVDCPVCTHPERIEIETAILDHRATIIDFSEELDIPELTISHHMEKHTKPLKSLIGRALAVGPELTRLTGLPGLPELTGLPRLTGLTELTGLAGLIQAGPQAACVGGHTRRTIFFCTPLRQNRT